MTYLAIYDQAKFQEIVFLITHHSVKTYSYIQIYSQKARRFYVTYLHPRLLELGDYLIKQVEGWEVYEKYKDFFTSFKKDDQEDEDVEKEPNSYTLEFIKESELVLTISKEDFLKDPEKITDFDFIIGVIKEEGIEFHQLFYELPKKEEDLEHSKIYYDVRSVSLTPNDSEGEKEEEEDIQGMPIEFVGNDYYFWIQNNVFTNTFLVYFLKRYYGIIFTFEKLKDYHLQIISKDMDIYSVKLNEDEQLKVLERGFDIVKPLNKSEDAPRRSKRTSKSTF
jgi:hypothetical protein